MITAESNNILFNLATEEYIFEYSEVKNLILFLWRNTPTIINGKNLNLWNKCHVVKLEEDGVILARRKSCMQMCLLGLRKLCFFVHQSSNRFFKEDFKTINNEMYEL